MAKKIEERWRESYLQRIPLENLTDQEKQEIRDILSEVKDMLYIDNTNLTPPLMLSSGESKSVSSRLWLLSRQNWMIIEQLSRLNQTMEKLLELEMSYADK